MFLIPVPGRSEVLAKAAFAVDGELVAVFVFRQAGQSDAPSARGLTRSAAVNLLSLHTDTADTERVSLALRETGPAVLPRLRRELANAQSRLEPGPARPRRFASDHSFEQLLEYLIAEIESAPVPAAKPPPEAASSQ